MAMLKKAARQQQGRKRSSGQAQMKMLRQLAAAAALHSRHRAGCARLFPGAAILAGGVGGEHRQHGAPAGRTATPPDRGEACRRAAARRRRSNIPMSGCITRARKAASSEALEQLPPRRRRAGTVGVLLLRSYVLAGNAAHYDGVIAALEARGCAWSRPSPAAWTSAPAIAALSSCATARPGRCGGLAHRVLAGRRPRLQRCARGRGDAGRARRALHRGPSGRIPDAGAVAGRSARAAAGRGDDDGGDPGTGRRHLADDVRRPVCRRSRRRHSGGDMVAHAERAAMLAARVAQLVALRRTARAERKIADRAVQLPAERGQRGTAAYLAVFASLHNTLRALKAGPATASRCPTASTRCATRILDGNADQFRHRGQRRRAHPGRRPCPRGERWLAEIEAQWGPAPGRAAERRRAPVRARRAVRQRLRRHPAGLRLRGRPDAPAVRARLRADARLLRLLPLDRARISAPHAVLHFGTHGALEFMPGKQAGLSGACWPDRLIGDCRTSISTPRTIRPRACSPSAAPAATLISYLTPPVAHAGLYRGLLDLKASLDRWRALDRDATSTQRDALAALMQAQAAAVDLAEPSRPGTATPTARIEHARRPQCWNWNTR